MNEIFISYATEDRERARTLASALRERSWDIWWDREIPLGKAFDEVIEKAIDQAKCVIVLWSAASVSSEWVRNEASEGKRRGILLPVFIEQVEAPLAFRSLNGADLSGWNGEGSDAEFLRLIERVKELLGQPASPSATAFTPSRRLDTSPAKDSQTSWGTKPLVIAALALIVVGAGFAGYLFRGGTHPEPPVKESASSPTGDELLSKDPVAVAKKRESGTDDLDMEKRIRDLVGNFGGAIPATSLARGFHVPDLGMRIAFLTSEQSASTLGAMSAGAVVMEVESGRPMAKAGIHVGDVVLSIAGKKIASEDDLRQAIFKIGPGKTQYSYRRDGDIQTVAVDCSGCKVE
jgi:hypothetical protein